jgi:hypothetical protein
MDRDIDPVGPDPTLVPMAGASPLAPRGGRVSVESNPSAALAMRRNEHGDDGSPAWGGQGRRPSLCFTRLIS